VTEHYDAIIVGNGAGGGTPAHTLARSGKRILLLERGDFLTRNPALTAMANAIRVGEHLLSRMS
jgi:flavin-dependent dehydrogenase